MREDLAKPPDESLNGSLAILTPKWHSCLEEGMVEGIVETTLMVCPFLAMKKASSLMILTLPHSG